MILKIWSIPSTTDNRFAIHFDEYLTELTWQVLIEGYLTFVGAPINLWTGII